MFIKRLLCEETPGDGTPGDGGTPKPDANAEALKSLGDGMNALAANMKTMQDNMTAMMNKPVVEPAAKPVTPTVDPLSADLESLDRKTFADTIVQAVVGRLTEDAIKPMADRVDNLHNTVETRDLRSELKATADAHKDFWDWKDEMGQQVQRVPGLSAQDAYQLARSSNVEKAAELDKKYAPAPNSDVDNPPAGGSFGGMRPGAVQTDPATDMKPDQAAEKAWEETMAELGDA